MEGETADRVGLGAVFLVTGDGMADVGGMDADLVLAAALEGEFGLGVQALAAMDIIQDLVVGDGQLAAADLDGGGPDFQGLGILHEPALDGAGIFFV